MSLLTVVFIICETLRNEFLLTLRITYAWKLPQILRSSSERNQQVVHRYSGGKSTSKLGGNLFKMTHTFWKASNKQNTLQS